MTTVKYRRLFARAGQATSPWAGYRSSIVQRNRTSIVPSVSTMAKNTNATPRGVTIGSALRLMMGDGAFLLILTQRATMAGCDGSIFAQRSTHGVCAGSSPGTIFDIESRQLG